MKKKVAARKKTLDKETTQLLLNLGVKLQELRKKKGYKNYEKFAYEHNLPRAQYGRYEKGQDLRISSLVKVLNALDISLKDFFSEGIE